MTALEFCLPPSETTRLLRVASGTRRTGRPASIDWVWHDTAGGALAAEGLSLCEQRGTWRLEYLRPAPGIAWPPGTPAPMVAEAAELEHLGRRLPSPLMPLAGFRGRQRVVVVDSETDPVTVVLTEGTLRGVTQERAVCRVVMTGPAPRLLALSSQLSQVVAIAAPRWSLAAEAIGLARGVIPMARQTGAPAVPPGAILADAVTLVLSHLTDVILAGALTAAAGDTPEPVHQMRVAVRRLRSALSIFRRAVDAPAFEAVKPGLKALAAKLGDARDWDVFLNGTGRMLGAALPAERRIAAMLEAGERRRLAAYAALGHYFDSDAFRSLEIALVQLTALRPWQSAVTEEQAAQLFDAAESYAGHALGRRFEHMLAAGPDLSGLEVEHLHSIRKQGKRLRYAAEFFSPLYGRRGGRRFVGRLSSLQEALGHLNDTAAAGALVAGLGGGADRLFAAGAVQGFVAAQSGDTRRQIGDAWSKFRRQDAFWT